MAGTSFLRPRERPTSVRRQRAGVACGQRVAAALAVVAAALIAPACADGSPELNLDVNAFITATEFSLGTNRFPFRLVTNDGASVTGATVDVRFVWLPAGSAEPRAEGTAVHHSIEFTTPHLHADGTVHDHVGQRGFYAIDEVTLDRPGFWMAEMTVSAADGSRYAINGAALEVRRALGSVQVGDRVPASRNRTLEQVADVEELSTFVRPVPAMYALSVAEALERREPFLVAFSTPAFCVSQMCGPVTDAVVDVHKRFGDRMSFIHIEPFDVQLARSTGQLEITPVVAEWGLETEPWVFVMEADGRVAARFEGMVAVAEIERAVRAVLTPGRSAQPATE